MRKKVVDAMRQEKAAHLLFNTIFSNFKMLIFQEAKNNYRKKKVLTHLE